MNNQKGIGQPKLKKTLLCSFSVINNLIFKLLCDKKS